MDTPGAGTDAQCCPLCGRPNLCAMEVERATGQKQPPCWCTGLTFTAELLQRVPAVAAGSSCICRTCAERPDENVMKA